MQRGSLKKSSRSDEENDGRQYGAGSSNTSHLRRPSFDSQNLSLSDHNSGSSRREFGSRLGASFNELARTNSQQQELPYTYNQSESGSSSRRPSSSYPSTSRQYENNNNNSAEFFQNENVEDTDEVEDDENSNGSEDDDEDEVNDNEYSVPHSKSSSRERNQTSSSRLHSSSSHHSNDTRTKKSKPKKSSSSSSKKDKSKAQSKKKSSSQTGKLGKHGSGTHKNADSKPTDEFYDRNGNVSSFGKKSSRDKVQFGNPVDDSGIARRSTSGMNYNMHRQAAGSFSQEVMPLQLEMPESVPDLQAFQRYLSRSESGAVGPGSSGIGFGPGKMTDIAIHRRTMALSHAIMTLALLSSSASQLRFVVAYAHAHSYPSLNYFLICTCIIIEILAGTGYVILSRFDFSEIFVEKIHSYLIFGLFIVAVFNVIIAAFALDDHVCEMIAKKNEKPELYDAIDQQQPQISPQQIVPASIPSQR